MMRTGIPRPIFDMASFAVGLKFFIMPLNTCNDIMQKHCCKCDSEYTIWITCTSNGIMLKCMLKILLLPVCLLWLFLLLPVGISCSQYNHKIPFIQLDRALLESKKALLESGIRTGTWKIFTKKSCGLAFRGQFSTNQPINDHHDVKLHACYSWIVHNIIIDLNDH